MEEKYSSKGYLNHLLFGNFLQMQLKNLRKG